MFSLLGGDGGQLAGGRLQTSCPEKVLNRAGVWPLSNG